MYKCRLLISSQLFIYLHYYNLKGNKRCGCVSVSGKICVMIQHFAIKLFLYFRLSHIMCDGTLFISYIYHVNVLLSVDSYSQHNKGSTVRVNCAV